MPRLSLKFLGPFRVALDDQSVTAFESNKVRALLAYLAVENDHPHSREALAGLLWPEFLDETARKNLRQALSNLRKAIGDAVANPPFLLTNPGEIQFYPESDYRLDVVAFASLLKECGAHRHRHIAACVPCAARLTEAATHFGGDLLEGFFVEGSIAFQEWLTVKREHFHRQAVEALGVLASYHERRGDFPLARRFARRQMELDPWREETHSS